MANQKQVASLVLAVSTLTASVWVGAELNWWLGGIIVLTVSISATLVPIVWAFLGFVQLNDPGSWFQDATQLGAEKQRVIDQYSRITGTLTFWKNKAAAHYRLHFARILWSLVSGVALPVLIQRYDRSDAWSVVFMTMLTTWTGFIVSLAYTLKSEEKYQGFRQQESDFYDVGRNLLDFASSDPGRLKDQVDKYLIEVNNIRKVGRQVETGSPPSAL